MDYSLQLQNTLGVLCHGEMPQLITNTGDEPHSLKLSLCCGLTPSVAVITVVLARFLVMI